MNAFKKRSLLYILLISIFLYFFALTTYSGPISSIALANNTMSYRLHQTTISSAIGHVIQRFLIMDSVKDAPLTYAAFLRILADPKKHEIADLMSASITQFEDEKAVFFESKPLTQQSFDEPFEFVLQSAPSIARMSYDPHTFQQYFNNANGEGIISVWNLGKDARLVLPSPLYSSHRQPVTNTSSHVNYTHLKAFLESAPWEQARALWRTSAAELLDLHASSPSRPLWFSTHGGGVGFLHVRLDFRPKYYSYTPYTHTRIE